MEETIMIILPGQTEKKKINIDITCNIPLLLWLQDFGYIFQYLQNKLRVYFSLDSAALGHHINT